jgi:cation diffusion facilitator family transporter
LEDSCCETKLEEIEELRLRQKGVLIWVLLINLVMFFVEFIAGWVAQSTALMADSLDMLGDASVYAFSLFVLYRGALWRARAGLLKGVIMLAFGLFVLFQIIYRIVQGSPPSAETMGLIGSIALVANLICLALLYRHRSDDINMQSTWICSRNDIFSNLSVIAAAPLVFWLDSPWPDLIVGFGIAVLFLQSGVHVTRKAVFEIKAKRD